MIKLVDKSQIKMNRDKCGIFRLKIKPKVKTKPKDPNINSKPPHGRRPPKKDTEPKYNPYGTGTANPENMSGSTGP